MGNVNFHFTDKPDEPCSYWTEAFYTAALEDDLEKLNEAASNGADTRCRKRFIDKEKKYKNIASVRYPNPYSFLKGR